MRFLLDFKKKCRIIFHESLDPPAAHRTQEKHKEKPRRDPAAEGHGKDPRAHKEDFFMICDRISRLEFYRFSESFRKAFDFLKSLEKTAPDGVYEIDGKNVYAMIQSYDTAPGGPERLEIHRRKIDLQYTLCGTEVLAWAPAIPGEVQTFIREYDPETDAAFLAVPLGVEPARLVLEEGCFAVFFPGDAHWGKLCPVASGPGHVRKVCVKIDVSLS